MVSECWVRWWLLITWGHLQTILYQISWHQQCPHMHMERWAVIKQLWSPVMHDISCCIIVKYFKYNSKSWLSSQVMFLCQICSRVSVTRSPFSGMLSDNIMTAILNGHVFQWKRYILINCPMHLQIIDQNRVGRYRTSSGISWHVYRITFSAHNKHMLKKSTKSNSVLYFLWLRGEAV